MSLTKSFLRDFSPWIIFQILLGFNLFDVEKSAIVALLFSVVFNFGRLKKFYILEWGTFLFFLFLSFGKNFAWFSWVEDHPYLASNLALAVISWVTLVFRVPFTLQYAKEMIHPAIAKRPLFYKLNYLLTLFCALIFSLMTAWSLIRTYYYPSDLVISDIITVFLIAIGIHLTKWFPGYYKKKKFGIPDVPNVNIQGKKKLSTKSGNSTFIRPGSEKDGKVIANYMALASGGIIDFLLGDLLEGLSATELLESFVCERDGEYSYKNTTVAEIQKKIVGVVHCYPISFNEIPDKEGKFIPHERVVHLKKIFEKGPKNSLYLHTIAVDPSYQNEGIGNHLLEAAIERAITHNFSSISLYAWVDNTRAVKWYKAKGFKTVKKIPIKPHPQLPHKGGMLLLKLDLKRSS